jgi:hypothetical protein
MEIIKEYNLLPCVSDGHIYMDIQKGMYGLPQDDILVNHLLDKCLALHGSQHITFTPGL